MASIQIPKARAALTANGGANGIATVADNSSFFPGAQCWLKSTTQAGKLCLITSLIGATQLTLRFVESYPTYTTSDLSAFLTVDSASIEMFAQTVPAEFPYTKFTKVP